MSEQKHILAYDLSNIAYISAHLLPDRFELRPDGADRVMENMISYARHLYHQFRPDQVIFACDSHHYWRKDIFPEYKGHRPNNELKRCVKDAITLFKQEKPQLCCEVESCEADDVMYVIKCATEHRVTIVSMDGDFFQLLDNRVRLYNPRGKQYVKAAPHTEFELFMKCIRGDRGDNIPSAYPRISRKRLWQAFNYDVEMRRIMETELDVGKPVLHQYELNRQLIDLSHIPAPLYKNIEKSLQQLLSTA